MRWQAMLMALGLVGCGEGGWLTPDPPKTGTSVALSVRLPLGELGEEHSSLHTVHQAHPVDEVETSESGGEGVRPGTLADQPSPPGISTATLDEAIREDSGTLHESAAAPTLKNDAPLVALAREAFVFREPDAASRRVGYLRAGALVQGATEQVSGRGCAKGFTRIEPYGYVCSSDVSTDPNIELATALSRRPNRRAEMPYWYGESRSPPPPFYNRVPTVEEQRRTEPNASRTRRAAAWSDFPVGEVPEFLRGGQASFRSDGTRRSMLTVSSGRAIADSAFAFIELFEENGRAFGLSTDLSILPLDRLQPVAVSRFTGVALGRGHELPLGFVRARNAHVYEGGPGQGLRRIRPIEFREAFSLSGERLRVSGKTYLETRAGTWIEDSKQLVVIEPLSREPHWAKPGKTWIDVNLSKQTLVAYEGMRPVYATLVSTGAEVATETSAQPAAARVTLGEASGDFQNGQVADETTPSDPPLDSRKTIEGQFRVHTKHVTATMDSDTPGDEFDLRDVPYVQYFSGNYALHAAFWHDDFGIPKSHGCINLSPLDARWLFDWTRPRVPANWHGAMSLLSGTLINVHQ